MKIDGRQIAKKILEELRTKAEKLRKSSITPRLAIILVGDDPASVAYVNQKKIKAELIGAQTTIKHFPSGTSQLTLLKTIQQFNNDKNVHGLIVQQPLPKHIDTNLITQAINPKKDVDGFNPDSKFEMPIAMAALKILEEIRSSTPGVQPQFVDWLKAKKIVVMGKGETGGKPIINALQKIGIEPAIIDSSTMKPELITQNADIIICAVGKANILKPQMIKRGVVLIGIGISKGESAKLMGDYDQNEIKNIASFYTPTPGGIGPVNVAMLLKNLITATEAYLK